MPFVFIIIVAWFGIILVVGRLLKIGYGYVFVISFIVLMVFQAATRPKQERMPSFPRPEGDSMEDRFRQREWDDVKKGLNP